MRKCRKRGREINRSNTIGKVFTVGGGITLTYSLLIRKCYTLSHAPILPMIFAAEGHGKRPRKQHIRSENYKIVV